MAIASMIVKPAANSSKGITEQLAMLPGVTIHSVTPQDEIIILLETSSLNEVNEVARQIETIPGVLGVYPTYITTADEDDVAG